MDLEEQFDIVIIGTGLTESIISAACSRIGKTVLHLDRNSFYGESWSSFNFEQLVEWLKSGKVSDALYFNSTVQEDENAVQNAEQNIEQATNSNDQTINWSDFYKTITNIEIISYLIEDEEENKDQSEDVNKQNKWWSTKDFKKISRKFNIDLCPKVVF